MRAILHIIILGLFIQNISGQTITVAGKILHEFDYSIPAGRIDNISIDSTYYSDLDGMFKFKCFKGDSIRFSSIGTKDSLVCFYSDTIVEIVLLHDGFSHSDGYKFEFKHNLHGLLGFDNDNYIIDYRYSWNHFSKREIGRRPIHLITNHIDIGLSYLNSDIEYVSGFIQLNDFFNACNFSVNSVSFNLLSPYINLGAYYDLESNIWSPRLDFGVYLIRISMFKYFSVALDSRVIQIDNKNDIFMGISFTKPMSRGAGWYD